MRYDYLIVGAGFAGCVLAERLASQVDKKVLIVEKRSHIGGNAYDEYDENGILVHRYGPHIFHTNSKRVFEYLSQFTEWQFYEHKVLAKLGTELYPIPINRITLNKLYNLRLGSDLEVQQYLENVRDKRESISNSEDIIVDRVGTDLFNKFFKDFTMKQWGVEPKDLSPSVCGRIPVRTNEDCRYFTDRYQFMPRDGYTPMFQKMISNKNIELALNTDYKTILTDTKFNRLIYTGPVDYFFDYLHGILPYRSIRFEFENLERTHYQPVGQINHVESTIEFTRVAEYKFLTAQIASSTTISREYAQKVGEPFYPIPSNESRSIFHKYKKEISKLKNISFCGRLAEYQYYNMDQVVANSLLKFECLVK
jgi:UDP-galactopyranose mutase